MDLEQRPGPEALRCQPLIQPDHRDLHDVRRGSLDRHVDGHPLARSAKGRIGRAQLRDLAAASQECRDEPIPARGLLDVEHVVADPGVRGEVRADEFLRLLAADAGPAGQTEVAHPVGEAEVDHLGHRSLVAGDLIGRLVEHAGRRLSMNVGLARECRSQVLVAGHVGDDPELDLRVVGRHQDEIGAAGHERPTDSSAEWRPDRDVLEVRVGRGQASGRGHGLVERGVDTAVVGDERRQRLDVGGSKLRVGAPVENRLDGRVDVHELLEDRRVGRVAGLGLAALGQLQLAEQHVAQLLRGADGEFVADGVEDRSLEPGDLGCELAIQDRQGIEVDGHADGLHPCQHGNERQLHVPEQIRQAFGLERRGQRIAGGEGRQCLQPHSLDGLQLLDRRQHQVQSLGHDVGDRLRTQGCVQQVRGELRVERDRCRGPGRVCGEPRDEQRFCLMGHDRNPGRLEHRAQTIRVGPLGSDHATIRSRERQRQGRAGTGAWIVLQERRADHRLGGNPGRETIERVAGMDFDPARVLDRGSQRGGEVVEPFGLALGPRGSTVPSRAGRDVEVERQLEAGTGGRIRRHRRTANRPATPPSTRALGPDSGRRDARVRGSQRVRRVGRRFTAQCRQPIEQAPELILPEQADDLVAVVFTKPGSIEVELHREIADDRREFLAELDLVAELGQLVTELVGLDVVEPGVHRIEVAVLANQLRRGFLADPGHARNVVGDIALEGLVVDHLGRQQAIPLIDLRGVVQDRVLDPGARGHQPDVIADDLEHVEVARHHRRVQAARFRLDRECPDDVVRLEPGELVDGQPKGLHDLAHLWKLVAEVVRHPGPGGLVLGESLVAEGGTGQVERHGDIVRPDVLDSAQDDAAEPEYRVDELTLRRREGREREISAVDEPVAVEQHQAFHRRASERSPQGCGTWAQVYWGDRRRLLAVSGRTRAPATTRMLAGRRRSAAVTGHQPPSTSRHPAAGPPVRASAEAERNPSNDQQRKPGCGQQQTDEWPWNAVRTGFQARGRHGRFPGIVAARGLRRDLDNAWRAPIRVDSAPVQILDTGAGRIRRGRRVRRTERRFGRSRTGCAELEDGRAAQDEDGKAERHEGTGRGLQSRAPRRPDRTQQATKPPATGQARRVRR